MREEIKHTCEEANCEYAILFGSSSRGEERGYSDVDLAVKFSSGDPVKLALELAGEIGRRLGKKVDVVPVELADSILKFEIFWRGVLVYCRNRQRYSDDRVNALDEYLDFAPRFERFYSRAKRGIKDAAAGYQSKD